MSSDEPAIVTEAEIEAFIADSSLSDLEDDDAGPSKAKSASTQGAPKTNEQLSDEEDELALPMTQTQNQPAKPKRQASVRPTKAQGPRAAATAASRRKHTVANK